MAHFAQLNENNEVINVIVIDNSELLDDEGNENEQVGINFCTKLLAGKWVQTSYNGKIRGKYAGIGDLYDLANDIFITPEKLNDDQVEHLTEIPTPPAE